ncbi:glycosyltransferase family 4 protein [Conexibacter sp. JD483]|uniref:glycosyltransferase family 4 protein n=1 Tax=unclassified Conexibacter TaxID=2627773 RepID=UPI002716537B|nr:MULTISPECIES: glycosyltransferase family 4 protein [unclassified Conexibacter]MDO8184063.1 glycosyltransferase family 4 protein [Conexibacter sp. CPCC 205706]MDO8197055.1 glycosyltransferase family 4 protein [Conexibacter sp. CPCC 205762]MDR9367971.1 glycosyltransferase family 4 protein [Conexibacter sp. JD483]
MPEAASPAVPSETRRRVVLLRGNAANVPELQAWEHVGGDYDVSVLVPGSNDRDVSALSFGQVPVQTVGERIPGGRLGGLATRVVGDRYLGLEERLRGADVVHAAELSFWFSWQAAKLKQQLGYKLALTVWETLPFVEAYRNVRTRRYRRDVIAATDLYLATTERARDALVLEGVAPERIEVAPPGISVDRFAAARVAAPPADGRHLILSTGRLVWEKGHQDLLRAVALLRSRGRDDLRVMICGVGPEERRLRGVAHDLGLDDVVEFRGYIDNDEMPSVYAQASCLVLASIAIRYWEEQFGLVLAEAMAAHVPVVAAASGAIPEVVGDDGLLFSSGDWVGLADTLARGPLAASPGTRRAPDAARMARYSHAAQGARLRAAYDGLLGRRSASV